MKITVFNGSPWHEEGHTHIMSQEFVVGAIKGGAKVQIIHLASKLIKPCTRCGACFYKTPGKCALDDDMTYLIDKFVKSDFVIFATPVYIDNITGIMKSFIDRLMPVFDPHYEKDSNGEHRRRLRYKKLPGFIIMSSCAFPEQSHFQVLQLFFQRMARSMHTEVIGEICRTAGGLLLLSKEEIKFRPAVEAYKKRLRFTGEEFARTGRITMAMEKELQQPLIDNEEYVLYANKMWDQILPNSS